ncbi:MAG: hypothetical protein H0T59_04900 [Chloroflexi bacterium]|nr:hypothetical protein [Chloroflexota bacterium]
MPVALLFLVSGSAAAPAEVVGSLATVGAITIGAGWLAEPLADGHQRRLVVGGFGYAIAVLATTLTLGTIQGARDFPGGTDLLGTVSLAVARAAYGALYLVVPAIALGMLWSVAAWRLSLRARAWRP